MTASANERLYDLTEQDFAFVVEIVYQHTGIVLGEQKKEMVYRRLMRCVRAEKLPSIKAYCDRLRQGDVDELNRFFNAITTNLTSFFREEHHFDYLTNTTLPSLIADTKKQRIRIWSSACSTGEEPYSIAMTLADGLAPVLKSRDIKILATDIDTDVLATAKAGIYHIERLNGVPVSYRQKWFSRGKGSNENYARIKPDVASLITFKQLNLLAAWPMKGPFDVIFCRNVLIYFDKATQEQLIKRFYQLLTPNGLLMLGHSENIGKAHQMAFNNIGRTIFQKKGG